MSGDMIAGVIIGFVVAGVLMGLSAWEREKTLHMIGKMGGYEKINGEWFRITCCDGESDE